MRVILGGYMVEFGPQLVAQVYRFSNGKWCVRYWPLGESCNRLRLGSQGYRLSSTRTARVLHVLLTSAVESQICKRRLGAFLRFAFFMESLSNLNGCPIQEWASGLFKPYCWFWWLVCSPCIFRFLDLGWGPYSVDRFADEYNHLWPRFDSRFWNPRCEALDTFTRSWNFDTNWVCTPPHLARRALKYMRSGCAQASLIVPIWRSAPLWPLLTSDGLHLAHFVEDWVDFLLWRRLSAWVDIALVFFGREDVNFRVLALRINFRSARFL